MACVLIVEDDADIRGFMTLLLSGYGYDTMTAANGYEALTQMQQRKPCVVLLDMMMPVMDGWQFRERQLSDPALADVPVVCLTAIYDPEEVTERLRLPCLQKPVELPTLIDAVAGACSANGS